jgi:hypothetical protein
VRERGEGGWELVLIFTNTFVFIRLNIGLCVCYTK